ncbi:glycosyltransferase family 4 protein [Faecalimonas sp.]
MKKVLMIACSFPPLGGPGVQRSVKFVKYLKEFGYEPIVFTRECKNEEIIDKTLLKDIPEGTKVVRTKDYIYTNMNGILKIPGKVVSRIMIPDYAAIWWKRVKKQAQEIIEREHIELIYSTSAPYSDHLLALYLKKKNPQLKWVADFRDEWTKNPYLEEDKLYKFKIAKERRMETEVLNSANAVIANTPIMKEHFLEGRKHLENKFFVIPNGFDKDDFKGYSKIAKMNNEKMTLTYTGALYGRRKPDTFFDAISQLIEEGKISKNKIAVRLVGNYNLEEINAKINKYNLQSVITIVGLLPHDECIQEQLACDALVLIEGSGKGAEAFYTGKLFEYMNTNKPILALLPEKGVAAELVRESNVGIVASVDCVKEIKSNIVKFYQQWENEGIVYQPKREVVEKYDRKKLTKQLSEIFEQL